MNLTLPSRFKFAQLKTQKHKEWNRLLLVANLAEKRSRNLGSAGIKANSPALNMMGARNVYTVLLDTLEMANASVSLAQKDAKNPKADEIKTFFQQSHYNISTLYKDWQELYGSVYMDWYSLSEAQRLKIQTSKDPQSAKERKRIQLVLSQLSSIQQDITKQFSQWSIVFFGNNLPGAQQVIDFTLDLLKNTQGGKLPIGGDGDESKSDGDAQTAIQQLILTDDLEVQVLKLKLINEGYDEYDLDNTVASKASGITSQQQQHEQTSGHLFKTKTGRTISEIVNTSGRIETNRNFRRELISGQPHEGKGDDESRALVLTRSLLGVEEDEKEKEKKGDGDDDKRVARVGQREERVARVEQEQRQVARTERIERVEETKSKPKKSKSSLFSLKNLSGLAGLGLKATALVATVKTVLVVSAATNGAVLGVHNLLKFFGYNVGWLEVYEKLLFGTASKVMAVGNFLAYNGIYNVEVNPALGEPSIDRSMLAETQSAMNRALFMISILRSTLVVGRVAKQWADQAAFRYEERERQMYKPPGDEEQKDQQDDQKDENGQVKEKKQKRNFLSKMARAWNRMNGVKINVPWLLYACGIGSVAGSYILDYVNGTAYQTFVPLSDLIPAKGGMETALGLLKKAIGLWGYEPPGKVDYIGEYVNIPWNMGIFMEFWNQLRDLNPGLYYTGLATGAIMEVLLVTIGGKILENLLNEYIVKPGKWKGLTDASNYRMQARCLLAVTRTIWNLSPFAFMASVMNLVGISMESSIELPNHKLDFVFDTTFASTKAPNAKKIFVPSDSAIDILADRYPSDKEFVLKMSKWFATHLLLSFTSTAIQTVIEVAENFRPLSDDEKVQLIADAAKQLDAVRDLARLTAVAKLTTHQKDIVHTLELKGIDATISQQKQSLLKLEQTGVADSTIRYLAKSSPLLMKLNQQRIAGGGGDDDERDESGSGSSSVARLLEESKDEKETKTKAIENVRRVGDVRTAIQTPEQKLIECTPYLDMANRLQNPKTVKLNQEKREGVLSRLQQLLPFGGGMSDFKEAANELTREENSKIKAQTTALAVAAVQADPAQMQQFIAKGNKAVDISASIMRQLQKNIKYEEPDERKEEKNTPDKDKEADDENENDEEEQAEEEREADDEPEAETESEETEYRDESFRSEQNSILNDEDEVA